MRVHSRRFYFMQWMRRTLFEAMPPLWKHVLWLWAIVLFGSLAIGAVVHGAVFVLGIDRVQRATSVQNAWTSSFQSIVFAPFVETLLLCVWVELLARFGSKRLFVAATAAVIAGLLHAIISPTWFFSTAWGFFVFASAYVAWRPASFPMAFTAALAPHALSNATGWALLFILD